MLVTVNPKQISSYKKRGSQFCKTTCVPARRQCLIADFGNVNQTTVYVERLYIRDMTDPASDSHH